MNVNNKILIVVTLVLLGVASLAHAQEAFPTKAITGPGEHYSPYVDRKIPREVYWGACEES